MSIMIFGKWVYYKTKGWHYYMTDFCYLANGVLLVYFNFYPKSETMFILSFCFANGCLATAVGAFRN